IVSFAECSTLNKEVTVHRARGTCLNKQSGRIPTESLAKIELASVAERGNERSLVGIERIQVMTSCKEDSPVVAIFPVCHSAINACSLGTLERIEVPYLLASGRVECNEFKLW